MTQPAIVVENLAKRYEIGESRRRNDTLRDELLDTCRAYLRRRRTREERRSFWALKQLSFEIQHGEVVGIIGSNGAGKSTLLKILSRITTPTSGFADIYGRVGSLLEVGTGFHPDLSGRENIFLNGAILGMKRAEIQRKFDEIVAFAEVEKFLDTPVKRYSSGMQIRLAFAVAAHLEPEILLIDEVLAVGDVNFQRKCLGKMENVAREGRTVLFVSHNLAAVEHLCHKGIVLRTGEQVFQGPAKDAISYYLSKVAGRGEATLADPSDLSSAPNRSSKYRPHLRSLELFTDGDVPLNGSVRMGAPLRVRIRVDFPELANIDAAIGFDTLLGQRVFTAHTWFDPQLNAAQVSGERTFVCDIPSLTFTPGEYKILVALAIGGVNIDVVEDATRLDVIEADYYGTGRVPWNGLVVMDHRWRLD
jgi:lipopolysaccharide transport system ATP-binding protein